MVDGNIPAYAGSTPSPSRASLSGRDHPRICGEHTKSRSVFWGSAGTSPHMRGAPPPSSRSRSYRGIIPAYAGSTVGTKQMSRDMRDHPRICGEHGEVFLVAANVPGSSPHMRGAPFLRRPLCHVGGIIPAYAGSTRNVRLCAGILWDHPRICGEHVAVPERWMLVVGSSPHMRGAQEAARERGLGRGIIPAYAGSTRCRGGRATGPRDHPRICGEHPRTGRPWSWGRGSSPHMRGALGEPSAMVAARRIIPAYAGSTLYSSPYLPWARDHPRICGEHASLSASSAKTPGSSPHMRGAQ